MPHTPRLWCVHPCHDEVLPNGKKRCWKTGPRPTHPKGQRRIGEDLAFYINSNNEEILKGNSSKVTKDCLLCSTCFVREENDRAHNERTMDVDACPESCDHNNIDSSSDDHLNSPMDDDCVNYEEDEMKVKLNHVFEFVLGTKIRDL